MKFIDNLRKISIGTIVMILGVCGMVIVLGIEQASPFVKIIGFCIFFLIILFGVLFESPLLKSLRPPKDDLYSEFE